jgi:single-strand DNA-binding protein
MIRLQFIGYLGHDAVQRIVNGKTVLGFRVAHTEKYRDQHGMLQEKTIWIDCSWWEQEKVGPYLTVGRQVYVEGVPALDTYVNNQGELIAILRLRVSHLKLLSNRRDTGRKETDMEDVAGEMEAPSDELPF